MKVKKKYLVLKSAVLLSALLLGVEVISPISGFLTGTSVSADSVQNNYSVSAPASSNGTVGQAFNPLQGVILTDLTGNILDLNNMPAAGKDYATEWIFGINITDSDGQQVYSKVYTQDFNRTQALDFPSFTPTQGGNYTINYSFEFGHNAVNLSQWVSAKQILTVPDTSAPAKKTSITTHFVDDKGNIIDNLVARPIPVYTNTVGSRMTYAGGIVDIPGYTYKESRGITGKDEFGNEITYFGSSDSEVDFVYTRNAVAATPSVNLQYSVSYISNGGTIIPTQMVDDNSTLAKPNDPTKSGYTFAGWFTDQDLTKIYNFSALINSNLVLYAKWNKVKSEAPTSDAQSTNQTDQQSSDSNKSDAKNSISKSDPPQSLDVQGAAAPANQISHKRQVAAKVGHKASLPVTGDEVSQTGLFAFVTLAFSFVLVKLRRQK